MVWVYLQHKISFRVEPVEGFSICTHFLQVNCPDILFYCFFTVSTSTCHSIIILQLSVSLSVILSLPSRYFPSYISSPLVLFTTYKDKSHYFPNMTYTLLFFNLFPILLCLFYFHQPFVTDHMQINRMCI